MSEFRHLSVAESNGVVTCTMSNPPRHTLVAAEVGELDQLAEFARGARRRARAGVHRCRHRRVHRALRSGRTRRERRAQQHGTVARGRGTGAVARVPPIHSATAARSVHNRRSDQWQHRRRRTRVRARLRLSTGDGRRLPSRLAGNECRHHSRRRRHATLRAAPRYGESARPDSARADAVAGRSVGAGHRASRVRCRDVSTIGRCNSQPTSRRARRSHSLLPSARSTKAPNFRSPMRC